MPTAIRNVCVYCASSQQARPLFYQAAEELGRIIAKAGISITYGGGAVGMMGTIADAALAEGGKVIGVLPEFMQDLEWGHKGLTELILTADMHARKTRMIQDADAVIAMAGGCGTLEELLEAITWKRLALHGKPIVVLNTDGFFDSLDAMLRRTIEEKFMRPEHAAMWTLVEEPADVLPAIQSAPPWSTSARDLATW